MAAIQLSDETRDAAEQQRQAKCAQRWIAEITSSEKAQRKWLDRSKKIVKRYRRDDSDTFKDRRFAMLWANTQTIQPAVYTRAPQPVVSRRFQDADPVARQASEVLERALAYSIDVQDMDGMLRQCSFDYVLLARGQAWERYVPTYGEQITPEIVLQVVTEGDDADEDGPDSDAAPPAYADEDGNRYEGDQVKTREDGTPYAEGEPFKPVVYEQSLTDYVNWEDFGHSVARTWDEVSYVWRRVYLGREQLEERFGEELGKKIPLDYGPSERGRSEIDLSVLKKAVIYELWDKTSKKVYWISKAWSAEPLDERDDPLGLDGFFPCPRPLLGSTANDSVIPIQDYVYYQDQAEEIDKLTVRIAELQDALKVRGFYAAVDKTNLNNLFNADNNFLIPVPEWARLKEDGGAKGMVEYWPIDIVVAALNAIVAQRQQLMNDIYQITGIADILRGMGDPRATATQEQLKGQWGTLRVRDRQIEMMRFARDILRIKGQVIAGKFSAETLKLMTGVQLPTAAEKAQVQQQIAMQAQQAQMMAQQQAPMGHNGGPPMGQPGQPPQPAAPPPAPEIPEEVQKMLSSPTWEDIEALLQNNALRAFRIDIETDSTIEPNEADEKARTVELLNALGNMVQQWGPALEAQPELAPMVGELIKFALRRFRAGRSLEDIIDTTIDKLVKASAQPKPGAQAPAPDPTKIAVEQIKASTAQMQEQGENQRAQLSAQIDQQELAIKGQEASAQIYALQRDPRPQASV